MLVVLKLGGSVITDKTAEESFKRDVVAKLAKEIAGAMKSDGFQLVLVHGAGSYGHIPAKKYGFDKGLSGNMKAVQEVNSEMDKLSNLVLAELKKAGIKSKVVHPAVMVNGESILSMSLKDVTSCLNSGFVPIIGGLIAEDVSGKYRVLSGDTIISYMATVMEANLVIVGSDIDGVYSGNPNSNRDAKLIPEINPRNVDRFDIGGSAGIDVSGGMRKKVDELLELTKTGISSRIINLKVPGRLRDALDGKDVVGTRIVP